VVSLEKIKLLGNAGSYDQCSGSECRADLSKSLLSSVYPAVTGTGKCINLFKTLMTNACSHNCNYCVNRHANCHERARYAPEELASTFLNMKRLGYVEGLFLSSGVGGDPDVVMGEMIRSVELLRVRHNFRGYVHLKVLPGASRQVVHQACLLADRVSINIETTPERLSLLSADKDYANDLRKRLEWLAQEKRQGLLPQGITTQLIVGAAGETDREIISTTSSLYQSFNLRRVYFSTFAPVRGTPFEQASRVNPLRGHRLYQADYLLRNYGFKPGEVVLKDGYLDLAIDPKMLSALKKPRVDVNNATYDELLRVPGIGPKTARRLTGHKFKSAVELKKIGVITKRAMPFIELNGQSQSRLTEWTKLLGSDPSPSPDLVSHC